MNGHEQDPGVADCGCCGHECCDGNEVTIDLTDEEP
jgi:hypothetical protein